MPSGSKLNKDLQDEREKVSFEVSEFTIWYHGGAKKVEEKRFLGNFCDLVTIAKSIVPYLRKLLPVGPGAAKRCSHWLSWTQREIRGSNPPIGDLFEENTKTQDSRLQPKRPYQVS